MFVLLTQDLRRDVVCYLPLPMRATLFVKGMPSAGWRRRWFVWRSKRQVWTNRPRQPFVFDTAEECVWALAFLDWARRQSSRPFPLEHVTDGAVCASGFDELSSLDEFSRPRQWCLRAWPLWKRQQLYAPDNIWWELRRTPGDVVLMEIHKKSRDYMFSYHHPRFKHGVRFLLEVAKIPIPKGGIDHLESYYGFDPGIIDILRAAEA